MTITKDTHPKLFQALLEIDIGNGAVNRCEPAATSYDIPEPWAAAVDTAEKALSGLSPEDYEAFATGGVDEMDAITGGDPGLTQANCLLDDFFNGWMDARNQDQEQ